MKFFIFVLEDQRICHDLCLWLYLKSTIECISNQNLSDPLLFTGKLDGMILHTVVDDPRVCHDLCLRL